MNNDNNDHDNKNNNFQMFRKKSLKSDCISCLNSGKGYWTAPHL